MTMEGNDEVSGGGSTGVNSNSTNPRIPASSPSNTNPTKEAEGKMFFTTSDLMKRMNDVLASNIDDPNDLVDEEDRPRLELQKRLPDGSTIRADESDMALADFQSKMKQAASYVEGLSSPEEKLEWAAEQRQCGNSLFARGEYKEAIDVYLTCLVAMDVGASKDTKGNDNHDNDDDHHHKTETAPTSSSAENDKPQNSFQQRAESEIKLPVLLNLSACSYKLGMHSKAERFCNLALEVPSARENAKVYFRRGQARMLMGSYPKARSDLNRALDLLSTGEISVGLEGEENNGGGATCVSREQKSIMKELKKLESLVQAAEKNHRRNKSAMKRVLGGERRVAKRNITIISMDEKKIDETNSKHDEVISTLQNLIDDKANDISDPLHSSYQESDEMHGLYQDVKHGRPYSTLTADDDDDDDELSDIGNEEKIHTKIEGFFRWYLSMIENGFRRTLYFLGDEDAMTRSYDDDEIGKEKFE